MKRLFIVNILFSWQCFAQTWTAPGSFTSQVYTFGGNSGEFYVGCFTNNTPQTPSQVFYKYDSGDWTPVSGSTNYGSPAFVKAIKVYDSVMYIGGYFITMSGPDFAYGMARESSGAWLP